MFFIYYCLKFIGLCPFLIDNKNPRISYIGSFYNLTLAFLFFIFSVIAYKKRFFDRMKIPNETFVSIIVDSVAVIFHNFTIIHCLLNLGFDQKKLLRIYNDFCKLEKKSGRFKESLLKKIKSIGFKLTILSLTYCPFSFLDHARFLINDVLTIKNFFFWTIYQSVYVNVFVVVLFYVVCANRILIYYENLNNELTSLVNRNNFCLNIQGILRIINLIKN